MSAIAWDGPQREKLWRYNQHYFDDLNAKGASERVEWHQALLADWVQRNTPGAGTGWEPYPTSLRIVNWIKWALAGNTLSEVCVHSLAVQARWLTKRLEIHLLGNHLFANAKALIFAGMYFSGDEAKEWLSKGLSILTREIPEQVLRDGGHFERSPMYHSIILEDLLDMINLAGCYGVRLRQPTQNPCITAGKLPVSVWIDAIQRMRSWLGTMCHPDGGISFFNDATFKIAPRFSELEAYAERLGLEPVGLPTNRVIHLKESGYVRIYNDEVVALLDVGEIGPDYLPGHAHADTLSFELSLYEQRVIVNSGISCYGTSNERLRQRGTAAHSTVEIDAMNSSEVWGGFRVARRARPLELNVKDSLGAVSVSCTHDGYRRLPGRPLHRRRWVLRDNELEIMDGIEGDFDRAIARFHLHPDVKVMFNRGGRLGSFRLKEGQMLTWEVSGGEVQVFQSTWHPAFGISINNQVIDVAFDRSEIKFILRWGES